MNDARLNHRIGEHGGDRVGEVLQAIVHGQDDILDTAVPEFVHHPPAEPRLKTSNLLR